MITAKKLTLEYVRENLLYCKNGSMIRIRNRTRPDLIGKKIGTLRPDGYIKARLNGSYYYLHRLVWMYHYGEINQGYEIDHIDGNPSNNTIKNLRLARSFENTQNIRTAHIDSKTGILGVTWSKKYKKYVVQIKRLDKRIAKYFKNIEEAELFYLETKRKFHEFGTL